MTHVNSVRSLPVMRALKITLLACALAAGCAAAPVLVQSVSGTPGAGGTLVFPSATTAGNTVVVLISWTSITYGPTALSDSQGNVYVKDAAGLGSIAVGSYLFAFHAASIKGGADTITVAACCGVDHSAMALEYSGASGIGAVSEVTVNSTPQAAAGLVNLPAGDLLLGWFATAIAQTWSAAPGFAAVGSSAGTFYVSGPVVAGLTAAIAGASSANTTYPIAAVVLDLTAARGPIAGAVPCPPTSPAPKLVCAYAITNTSYTASGQYVQTWFSTGEPVATQLGTAPATKWTSCMTGQTEDLLGSGNFTSAAVSGACTQ